MGHISLKILLMVFTSCVFADEQWPQYMGPNRDGSVAAPGLFDGQVALELIWTQPLGSGFSGIVVGGGKLYTMYADQSDAFEIFDKSLVPDTPTDSVMDVLSCFDAATGLKLWSYEYGASFPKVGSSEPGPLSTPVLDGNRVYGLGARGELFCLEASSGKLVWARDIVKELGAVQPDVGITTSPLISGDLLILNVGDRKDKGIAALNKKTGELAWHLGDEKISFQSPSLVTLMGRTQIVSLSETKMRGIDPATGTVIWEKGSKSWIQLFAIGENQLLSGHYHGLTLHRIDDAGGIKVLEKWNNRNLVLEYDMPVHHKGYLYGFKGESVTCLNVATGEKVWSSPKAGRGMAILVDGHLAITSEDGSFRIVRAWEKGYEERASINVFEKSGLTEPSYADRVFYMRNYTHLAAVKVK